MATWPACPEDGKPSLNIFVESVEYGELLARDSPLPPAELQRSTGLPDIPHSGKPLKLAPRHCVSPQVPGREFDSSGRELLYRTPAIRQRRWCSLYRVWWTDARGAPELHEFSLDQTSR
jgi:hypothetical protein